jgi:hypothetical protein
MAGQITSFLRPLEFICSSRPSLDALGVCEKSEGKESLRRLASNTVDAERFQHGSGLQCHDFVTRRA